MKVVEIGEFHALACELVDMGRLDIGVTVAAHLVVALVVRENEHHIWLFPRQGQDGHQKEQKRECKETKQREMKIEFSYLD